MRIKKKDIIPQSEDCYGLILLYKPLFTKEQVEEHLRDKISTIIGKIGIKVTKAVYCDNKMLAYPIKKHKTGHYACVGFSAMNETKRLINQIPLLLNDIEDLLRVIVIKTYNIDGLIKELIDYDTYIEEKVNDGN